MKHTPFIAVRLPMAMCYAVVELVQRNMQDDGRVLHLCPPARAAVSAQGVVLNALRSMRAWACMLHGSPA
ncbi:hypothetical protein XaplCFBP3122_10615 [Xanthomonas arboricola pv. populi]|uniref:Uncharacterized protein n=1 Tax=Xanthomonas arboricola pv. populi TaxID=487823 RepID=A0A2S6Z4Z0_9XANT|nr:hypothetical protein XaplCFBP3122_10615 [Xanthomonas arboricola pv. populi]